MKSYLIIPMGGAGKRFVDLGYKTYKVFLPVNKKSTIFEKIVSNFKGLDFRYTATFTYYTLYASCSLAVVLINAYDKQLTLFPYLIL